MPSLHYLILILNIISCKLTIHDMYLATFGHTDLHMYILKRALVRFCTFSHDTPLIFPHGPPRRTIKP